MNLSGNDIPAIMSLLGPIVVGLMAWGGMRAELRQMNERIKQLEDSLLQLLLKK